MDLTILAALNGLAGRSPLLDAVLIFLAEYAVFLLPLPLLALLVGIGFRQRNRRVALVALIAVGLSLLLSKQIGNLVNSPRPFAVESGVVRLVDHRADSGMPSSHTAVAFALAISVALSHRRLAEVMLVVGALVGLARVAVGVHWPSQILAGALLGIALAIGAHLVVALAAAAQHRRLARAREAETA